MSGLAVLLTGPVVTGGSMGGSAPHGLVVDVERVNDIVARVDGHGDRHAEEQRNDQER